MILRSDLLKIFEESWVRSDPPDYFRNLRLYEALYQEARALGVLPPQDPLEGIEVDIRLAKVLNVRTSARKDRPETG